MGFYWKGDQLVARKGLLDESSSASTPAPESTPASTSTSPWTTFDMPLRPSSHSPMPKAFDFLQFLCSSLTFMNKLRSVEVWFDDWRIGKVEKSAATPRTLVLPQALKTRTPAGLMEITGVESVGEWFYYLRCIYAYTRPETNIER